MTEQTYYSLQMESGHLSGAYRIAFQAEQALEPFTRPGGRNETLAPDARRVRVVRVTKGVDQVVKTSDLGTPNLLPSSSVEHAGLKRTGRVRSLTRDAVKVAWDNPNIPLRWLMRHEVRTRDSIREGSWVAKRDSLATGLVTHIQSNGDMHVRWYHLDRTALIKIPTKGIEVMNPYYLRHMNPPLGFKHPRRVTKPKVKDKPFKVGDIVQAGKMATYRVTKVRKSGTYDVMMIGGADGLADPVIPTGVTYKRQKREYLDEAPQKVIDNILAHKNHVHWAAKVESGRTVPIGSARQFQPGDRVRDKAFADAHGTVTGPGTMPGYIAVAWDRGRTSDNFAINGLVKSLTQRPVMSFRLHTSVLSGAGMGTTPTPDKKVGQGTLKSAMVDFHQALASMDAKQVPNSTLELQGYHEGTWRTVAKAESGSVVYHYAIRRRDGQIVYPGIRTLHRAMQINRNENIGGQILMAPYYDLELTDVLKHDIEWKDLP